MLKLKEKHGFTLVEIMIVVAIISLLAAIAIPNLLRARHNANEAAAIASLRTLSTSMESWRAVQSPAAYTLASLTTLSTATPAYIDTKLGSGAKQGYDFAIQNVTANTYEAVAKPQVYQTTGTRSFIVQEDGVLKAIDKGGSTYPARGEGTAID